MEALQLTRHNWRKNALDRVISPVIDYFNNSHIIQLWFTGTPQTRSPHTFCLLLPTTIVSKDTDALFSISFTTS